MAALKVPGASVAVIDGKERVELYPESETRFFEPIEENEVVFVKGAAALTLPDPLAQRIS